MDRRQLLRALVASTTLAVSPGFARPARPRSDSYDWMPLERALDGRLIKVVSPLVTCADAGGKGADVLLRQCRNPFYLGDEAGLTQTLGWVGAWATQPSDRAVVAASATDVAAAVNFARQTGIRLVVKGGGHSYFGNSNGANSLLIWTRKLRSIEVEDAFRGQGWPGARASIPAVTLGAGCLWGEVYRAVARRGRAVLGGGCLTVGVAGFVLGGGFGSLSKAFGTGASNLLEAEVVTADGNILIVNDSQHPELFFALRGGGGGSFGVVTRLTVRTYPLPPILGAVQFKVRATSDASYARLVRRMVEFYSDNLFNANWGEQIRFSPGRRMSVSLVSHGLDRSAMTRLWQPLFDWLATQRNDYEMTEEPRILAIPGDRIWDPAFERTVPGMVLVDDRPGASPDNVFWSDNAGEAGQTLNAYQSSWLPAALLAPARQEALAEALIGAASAWPVTLHTNKGLAGGAPDAIAAVRATAMNPQAVTAFALLICAADGPPAWPRLQGHEPDVATAHREAAAVTSAMRPIRDLVPDAGSYVSESDYHQDGWKLAYWGHNYAMLSRTKRVYDAANLFRGHHCVELS